MLDWICRTRDFIQWHVGYQNYQDYLIALVLGLAGSFLGAVVLAFYFSTFAPIVWYFGLWAFVLLPWMAAGAIYYRSTRG